MRVLALVPHPPTVASVRFRVAQYVEPLSRRDIHLELAGFFEPEESRSVYGGRLLGPARATLRAYRRRLADLRRIAGYDAVLVHREIAPFGNGVLADRAAATGVPYLYDFDDAIYLPAVGARLIMRTVRNARHETDVLCRHAAVVLAGNPFLAGFARRRGARVEVLPTVVDTSVFRPGQEPVPRPTIAWVGSHSTERYLEPIADALRQVSLETGARVRIVSQRARERIGGLEVEGVAWRLDDDASYFRDAAVGIYPLEDDGWGRGKCGLKALLFLASGVPVVASPVGVLTDMVVPGETGFLARTPSEWAEHLRTLLTDEALRRRMGARGRELVQERYSLDGGAEILAAQLRRHAAGACGTDAAAAAGAGPAAGGRGTDPAADSTARALGTAGG